MTAPNPLPTPPAPITLGQAFRFWLKLGFISFGGPAGQIRDHAPGIGRAAALDFREALPACVELLHVIAGS